MRSKKAVVGMQFNWIFVLIAGAIILGMFFAIANTLRTGSKEKIDLEVSADLKSTLIGAKVATGSSNIIPIPAVEIAIDPDGIKVGALQSIKIGTVFGPRKLSGNKMIVWSHDWSIPFRIANFLYITTPKVKYYFIGPGTFVDHTVDPFVPTTDLIPIGDFLDEFPEDVNYEVFDSCDQIPAQLSTALHIRVVIMGDDPGSFNCDETDLQRILRSHKQGGSLVQVRVFEMGDVAMPFRSGVVKLWSSWPGTVEDELDFSAFYGDATLYGAVFSDPSVYKNSLVVAARTATMVFNSYSFRSNGLVNDAAITDNCKSIYALAQDTFNEVSEIPGPAGFVNILNTDHVVGTSGHTPNFHGIINDLMNYNEQAQLESCPTIY